MPDEASTTSAMATTNGSASSSSYLFDVEDSPSNIALENGQMKLATIEKVVERVTSEKYFDPNFLQVFLLTYRQFITPKQLIDLLTARYNMPEPEGMTKKDEIENFRKYIETPVRLRIYNAVKHWISRHWVDFEENTEMIKALNGFIALLASTNQTKEAENLEKILKKMVEDKQKNIVFMFDKQPPKPIPMAKSRKTDHIPLLQIHPEEAARQLTLIEYDLFKSIKSWEFLNQGWTKKDKATRAPGIVAMTKRFNEVSKWVATEIVSEKDKKARVLLLNRLIEVAERCKNLNNLNAMTSIIAGLQSSSIYRLKGLWPELPSKQLDIFEEMVELISSKQSYKNFREYLRRCEPPCIPYLGVYLTDLTFIEDGNPNLVNGMLNLNKCRSISQVILQIQQYQQTPYCLEPVTVVQQYLNTLKFLEEDQCYKLSLQIEARSTAPTSPAPTTGPGRTGSTSGSAPNGVVSGSGGIDSMEVRIRLPGAKLPIEVPITNQTTAAECIKSLTQQFLLPAASPDMAESLMSMDQFQLVVPPSQTMYGAIIEADQVMKELQIQSNDAVLEMWESPIAYKVGLSLQSNQPVFQDVVLSHSMELMKMIPIFQKIFDLISSEEFCFLYVEPAKDGYARFLRANRSLRDEKCSLTEGRLLIYPVSNFKTSSAMFSKGATKQGYLVKKSQAKQRSLLKTVKKSRWFVLKDFFLFYFKSSEDLTHLGTIILDYCSCKMVEVSGSKSIQLRSSCTEFANHNCVYLYSEAESELDEWFNTINKRIVNSTSDMEGYLTMYILPNTSKHTAQKKWFCLEKNGSVLQYAKTMHQPEFDDSISLEESYCRLATNDLNNRAEGESSIVLVTPQTQYLLVAGNVGLRDLWIEALALHGVPFERASTNASKTFGEELDVLIQREGTTVPRFFTNAIQYLTAHAMQESDLFHTLPPYEEANRMKDMIDEGIDIDLATCSTVHTVGYLLLHFLTEIPHTLLTYFRYDKFVEASEVEDSPQRVSLLKLVVDTMPPTNRAVLRQLLEFLSACGASHLPFVPVAAAIMHDTEGTVTEASNIVLSTLVQNHRTIFPGPPPTNALANNSPRSANATPNVPRNPKMIHIPRLSKIFKMSGSNSSSNDLSKVASSTNLNAHKASPSISPSPSANGSPSSPASPLSQSVTTPTSSPTTASPLGGATASPRELGGSGNIKKGSGGITEDKIIIHYGEKYELKIEVKLSGAQSDFTLKDFLLACEYDSGCLRSVTDPTVTIMADNFVVPAGEYNLHKSSRSGSFLSSRLKHLSIPVNQLMRLAEVQKAMNTESGTAFKFPLSIQDAPPHETNPSSPLSSLARRPTNMIPAPIARTPPPNRRPRTSFPPHLITSPPQGTLPRSPSTDSQDSSSDSSPPTSPTSSTSPRIPPTPPSRASRTFLTLSQPDLEKEFGDPELSTGNELHNSDSTLYKNSYTAHRRRIAPARQNEVAEVQHALRQQNIVGGRVTGRSASVANEGESQQQKMVTSPSMNSLAGTKGSTTTSNSTANPKLRRVQTQPSLRDEPEDPHTSLARIMSNATANANANANNTSRPDSPPNTSNPQNPNQRVIKGSTTNISVARPPQGLSKAERVMGSLDTDKDKKDKDKDKKEKKDKDKEKKDKKDKEKEEKKDKKEKEKVDKDKKK